MVFRKDSYSSLIKLKFALTCLSITFIFVKIILKVVVKKYLFKRVIHPFKKMEETWLHFGSPPFYNCIYKKKGKEWGCKIIESVQNIEIWLNR